MGCLSGLTPAITKKMVDYTTSARPKLVSLNETLAEAKEIISRRRMESR